MSPRLDWTISQTSFVFDDFYSLRRTGQVYCRVPLSLSLCDFFFFFLLMIKMSYGVLEEKAKR